MNTVDNLFITIFSIISAVIEALYCITFINIVERFKTYLKNEYIKEDYLINEIEIITDRVELDKIKVEDEK